MSIEREIIGKAQYLVEAIRRDRKNINTELVALEMALSSYTRLVVKPNILAAVESVKTFAEIDKRFEI